MSNTTAGVLATVFVMTLISSSFVVAWPTFFLVCGLSNLLQCAGHFILLGGEAAKIRPPLGWMPEGPPDYGRAAGNFHGDANSSAELALDPTTTGLLARSLPHPKSVACH